jgi:hypothetical protein
VGNVTPTWLKVGCRESGQPRIAGRYVLIRSHREQDIGFSVAIDVIRVALEFLLTFSLRRASVSSEEAVAANKQNVKERLLEIGKMPKPELLRLWRELYGTAPPKKARRDLLVRFVAYRLQEQTLGGLSHTTKSRLLKLARRIEKDPKTDLIGVPQIKPGTCLVRDWHGKPNRPE